jgi:hypothetical protein
MHTIADPANYALDQHRSRTAQAERGATADLHRRSVPTARAGSGPVARLLRRLSARRADAPRPAGHLALEVRS